MAPARKAHAYKHKVNARPLALAKAVFDVHALTLNGSGLDALEVQVIVALCVSWATGCRLWRERHVGLTVFGLSAACNMQLPVPALECCLSVGTPRAESTAGTQAGHHENQNDSPLGFLHFLPDSFELVHSCKVAVSHTRAHTRRYRRRATARMVHKECGGFCVTLFELICSRVPPIRDGPHCTCLLANLSPVSTAATD